MNICYRKFATPVYSLELVFILIASRFSGVLLPGSFGLNADRFCLQRCLRKVKLEQAYISSPAEDLKAAVLSIRAQLEQCVV